MGIHTISVTIESALTAAGLNPESPTFSRVSETIRKALAAAGIAQQAVREPELERGASAAREVTPADAPAAAREFPEVSSQPWRGRAKEAAAEQELSEFTRHTFSLGKASRAYKLFVPAALANEPRPLIVMLHGCKQNPDDFAAGTRMNELAQRHGFLVAYPEQTSRANGANCWNWFESGEQSRDGEEASLIAGIVGDIGRLRRVDEKRVFVAGLSAGGAMAVILGAAYPEVFAAVGVHSGLPLGAAHDVSSAFAAMRGGPGAGWSRVKRGSVDAQRSSPRAVPTIVFHGDADTTVNVCNGDDVTHQASARFTSADGSALHEEVLPRQHAQGRDFTTTRYLDDAGRSRVERWVVHGASHAWSGGNAKGSYTDSKGPEASEEMLRFFMKQ